MEPTKVRDFMVRNPLAAALAISLAIHLTLFGTWRIGKHLGWWSHQATWLLNLKKRIVRVSAKQIPPRQPALREIPLTFVEVDPVVAMPDPPKDTKFYGVANTKAANPDVKEAEKPKVDGKQTQVVKTETVPRFNPQPMQPAPQPQPAKPAPQPEPAKPKEEPGDVVAIPPAKEPAKERVRTLAAAKQQKNIVGEKIKQDGGVKQRGKLDLDVKATPFGAYDALFISAVQKRWFDILDSHPFTQRSGKVVLEFRLKYDGTIMEMRQSQTEVGPVLALLCEKAIRDGVRYKEWPKDMRATFTSGYRDVKFTFIYY